MENAECCEGSTIERAFGFIAGTRAASLIEAARLAALS